MDIRGIIQDYISQLNRSESTIRAYTLDLKEFSKFVTDCNDQNQLRNYQHVIMDKNGPATAKRKIASVGALYSWMFKTGKLDSNPFAAVKIYIKSPDGQYIDSDEKAVETLLKNAKLHEHDVNGLRNLIMCELLVFTGCALKRLRQIRKENFAFNCSVLSIENQLVDLPKSVTEHVIRHMDENEERIEQSNGYIIYGNKGKALSDSQIAVLVKELSDGKCTPRSLRARWIRMHVNDGYVDMIKNLNVKCASTVERMVESFKGRV